MKRFGIAILAALMVVSLTIPAWAIESEFGGYWRTRFYTQQNFTGEDRTEAADVSAVDTRTRLYYTAIFHENLKFVNKFEFDATWGSREGSRDGGSGNVTNTGYSNRGYGMVGADAANLEIKASYIDFNLGPVHSKIGVQPFSVARSLLIDAGTEAAGLYLAYKGDSFTIPFMWIKPWEGGQGNNEYDTNGDGVNDTTIANSDYDVDVLVLAPSFNVAEMFTINPYIAYFFSDDASNENTALGSESFNLGYALADADDLNLWYLGLDIDVDFGMGSAWFTGIYQGGDVDYGTNQSADFKAWLVALGGEVDLGTFDIHGQAFYATGDDDGTADGDIEHFFVAGGFQSYYWAEIMGYGDLGDTSYAQVSNNSPADKIGNIWAANLGATVKPMDKLKIRLDIWYAALNEGIVVNGSEEETLGTEVDLKISYELVQNLNMDIIGAYLFAGDATTEKDPDDADPYEVGVKLSLSF